MESPDEQAGAGVQGEETTRTCSTEFEQKWLAWTIEIGLAETDLGLPKVPHGRHTSLEVPSVKGRKEKPASHLLRHGTAALHAAAMRRARKLRLAWRDLSARMQNAERAAEVGGISQVGGASEVGVYSGRILREPTIRGRVGRRAQAAAAPIRRRHVARLGFAVASRRCPPCRVVVAHHRGLATPLGG